VVVATAQQEKQVAAPAAPAPAAPAGLTAAVGSRQGDGIGSGVEAGGSSSGSGKKKKKKNKKPKPKKTKKEKALPGLQATLQDLTAGLASGVLELHVPTCACKAASWRQGMTADGIVGFVASTVPDSSFTKPLAALVGAPEPAHTLDGERRAEALLRAAALGQARIKAAKCARLTVEPTLGPPSFLHGAAMVVGERAHLEALARAYGFRPQARRRAEDEACCLLVAALPSSSAAAGGGGGGMGMMGPPGGKMTASARAQAVGALLLEMLAADCGMWMNVTHGMTWLPAQMSSLFIFSNLNEIDDHDSAGPLQGGDEPGGAPPADGPLRADAGARHPRDRARRPAGGAGHVGHGPGVARALHRGRFWRAARAGGVEPRVGRPGDEGGVGRRHPTGRRAALCAAVCAGHAVRQGKRPRQGGIFPFI